MNIAVLSLTRDRLEYTQHCFASLRENAGCDYDHYVLDQASTDGTRQWLTEEGYLAILLEENVGISRGMNMLLDHLPAGYDVIVTFDNDCEVVQPGTLRACAEVAAGGRWIVSPRVQGLINTPEPGQLAEANGEPIGVFHAIGGIFRTMPGDFAYEFRFNPSNPIWGGDEADVGFAANLQGLGVGYLLNWSVNHYETTVGQRERYPAYFDRKDREWAAA